MWLNFLFQFNLNKLFRLFFKAGNRFNWINFELILFWISIGRDSEQTSNFWISNFYLQMGVVVWGCVRSILRIIFGNITLWWRNVVTLDQARGGTTLVLSKTRSNRKNFPFLVTSWNLFTLKFVFIQLVIKSDVIMWCCHVIIIQLFQLPHSFHNDWLCLGPRGFWFAASTKQSESGE